MSLNPNSYFRERMGVLGISESENSVHLWNYDSATNENVLRPEPVFRPCEQGIEILVYTLDRRRVPFAREGSRWRNKDYCITRLAVPVAKANGDVQKYSIPKGQPTFPFFPPLLLERYEKSERIPVLYLTEGYFKAFKAQMHGIDCIGLASITCMREKETGLLHADITRLIERCRPERVVWLTDGDCKDITSKDLSEEVDLSVRPRSFYKTVETFQDLLSKTEARLYWAHINSENHECTPKGVDDLLCAFPGEASQICEEFCSFERSKSGRFEGQYLVRFEVTHSVSKVYRYFLLHDVTQFYLHHAERRTELLGRSFKFFGSLYCYEDREGKCLLLVPSCAENYFRVGDTYYEYLEIPDQYGNTVQTYHKRDRATIAEDNGKAIFTHIRKYKAFCVVPSHTDYQRVISNCFNLYAPFVHEPEEGDCSQTLSFLKHIFGEQPVEIAAGTFVPRYELGLDYLTLLYKRPQQMLPILCLVSRERQTGKTTFNKWLKLLFQENMAIVGNQDLASEFNTHWSSKLIVACDETKIEKHIVVEKVKSLATASEIMMNPKGKDQVAMKFFAKFILNSNNEENFINIDEEEIRFWIIKVPTLASLNVRLLDDMASEIPAFLHLLNARKMVSEEKERHWFDSRLLETDALVKVKGNSKSWVEQQLRVALSDLFIATNQEQLYFSLNTLANEVLKRPNDKSYIKRVLIQMGYFLSEPRRTAFPRLQEIYRDGEFVVGYSMIKYDFPCRCYEFNRRDFVREEN